MAVGGIVLATFYLAGIFLLQELILPYWEQFNQIRTHKNLIPLGIEG